MKEIYKIENYTDKKGRTVTSIQSYDSSSCEFIGTALVQNDKEQNPSTFNFPFPTGMQKLEEAFEKFDEYAQQWYTQSSPTN